MSDARAAVLARVRDALGSSPETPDVPRDYLGAGAREPAGDPAIVDRFADRVAEYRATVHRVTAPDLATTLAALTDGLRTASTFAAPDGAAAAPDDATATATAPGDGAARGGQSVAELDALEVVVTGCAVAVADTGTIVLDAGPASGPRALTLIPDHHVCVVRAEQVVAAVPDAIAAVRDAVDAGRALTLVSGPSATSDIELERVEGVHGPRRLDVVLVG